MIHLGGQLGEIRVEIDLYDGATKTLYEIKVSQFSSFNMEWKVQLLFYTHMLRKLYQLEVREIAAYNALTGQLWRENVADWEGGEALVEFLVAALREYKGGK